MGALFNLRHPALVTSSYYSLWGVLFDTGRLFLMHSIASQLIMLSGLLLILCFLSVPGMLPSTTWMVPEGSALLWSLPHFWLQTGVGVGEGLAVQLQLYQDLSVLKLCQTPYWL